MKVLMEIRFNSFEHSLNTLEPSADFQKQIDDVLNSWRNSFSYTLEEPENSIVGLRTPQIGAIHATLAHWAVSTETATIVMPTGTGKTETMLSVLIIKRCQRLLVIVPTDVLRTQISGKFLGLGILKEISVASKDALFPIVGILRHIPKTVDEVDNFFMKCQVIVTTMKIVAESEPNIQDHIATYCPYVFIDEAHHVAAPTWKKFTERFQKNSILQFTATPFRNDGKPILGKIIFNYPLRKAQKKVISNPLISNLLLNLILKKLIW
ncbi:MAG: DEAD/DEAH box helicase family protein [Chloroflexi bacterium]|nr:DEAD/DEAH box helicase family protein [Chloroflexota bacterium]